MTNEAVLQWESRPGRVGDWCHCSVERVSSPRHIARGVRIFHTARSCTLRDKGYGAYWVGASARDGG